MSNANDVNRPLLADHQRSHTPPSLYHHEQQKQKQRISSDTATSIDLDACQHTQINEDPSGGFEDEDGSTLVKGFQRPDRKEITAMIISGTLVIILSIAAGLTTIFDWVL
jgi:hypothetical protein